MATGQTIADEARDDLNDSDAGALRWSDASMLRYINAAIRQIVTMLPEANVAEEEITLAAGSKQALPAGGVKFLALYNLHTDAEDTYRGAAITTIEQDALDSSFSEWMFDTLDPGELGTIQHVVHDPREPKAFVVFPAVNDAVVTEALVKFSKIPTVMANLAATFPLGDEYINPTVEYTKWRMLSRDGRFQGDQPSRDAAWNNFRMALGLKPEVERRVDPARGRAGGDDNG